MAANIELIAKIVQKNGGTFKLLDAVNIDWAGFSFADLGTDALAAMKVYTIEQTDSKIAAAVAAAPHLQRKKVDALPAVEDASENFIYMVKRATSTTSPDGVDAYDEYMLIDGAFEHIGSTVVDLSDYIKTEDAEEKIAAALLEAKTYAESMRDEAKGYADSLASNYATNEQGAKADSAVQPEDIVEGTTKGAIHVGETAVPVHGLGTAAYENKEAFDAAGAADAALEAAKGYTDEVVGDVDLSGIAANAEAIGDLQEALAGTEEKATKNAADIVTANGNIAKNAEDIRKLNADDATEGSVDYKVKQAKDALQAQIEQLGEISGGNITTITNQVEKNTAAITKLNGGVDENGSVDQKVNAAKTELQGNIDSVEDKADAAAEAAEAAQGTADEAVAAAGVADGKAVAAQGTADEAVAAASVADGKAVAAQNAADAAQEAAEAAQGTADDAVAAAGVADGKAVAAQAAAEAAQGTADEAVAAAEANAGEIEALKPRVEANEQAIAILTGGEDVDGSVAKQVATAVASIVAADEDGTINKLEEIAAWIKEHPESVADLNAAIQANATAIANLKLLVGEELPADATSTTVIAYIEEAKQAAISAAAADAKSKADAAQAAAEATAATLAGTAKSEAIAAAEADAKSKADAAQAAAEETAAGLANAAKDAAIAAAEADATAKAGTAKSEAISAAAADATTKAGTAKSEAIVAAEAKATELANAAQAAAEATAAADAKSKADAAQAAAEAYADGLAGNYATAAQGAKADSALQGIAGVTATVGEDKVATVTGISTDLLTQGINVLVLNGGSAF